MLKEFCDRCRKEMPKGYCAKRYISASIYPECNRTAEIKFTLCEDCAKETGVDEVYDRILNKEQETDDGKRNTVKQFLKMMWKALTKAGGNP